MLLRRTESHHPLDARPVVPRPVEQDDLTPRRQVRHIALVVPLPALPLGGCRQRGYPRDARAQIFRDALDGPTLARGVATFEDDHDPGPGFPGPFLEPHEFRLKPEKFGSLDVFGDLSRGLLTRFLPTSTHDASQCGRESLGGFQQFIERFAQQARRHVEIAHRFPVGVDAEIQHAVVRRDTDGQHLVGQQRWHRVRLQRLGARDIHLLLRTRHIGDK
jgi:hypothetical protein